LDQARPLLEEILSRESLLLEGVLSHFAQSDEADKTFASLQLSRFNQVLRLLEDMALDVPLRHVCNSGGFLDLPQAHFDMVRLGILPLGVYPSSVCRRIAGIEPVLTVKARIAAIQKLEAGDVVGYGMRYTAAASRRIGDSACGLRRWECRVCATRVLHCSMVDGPLSSVELPWMP
jgi:alanine racemase